MKPVRKALEEGMTHMRKRGGKQAQLKLIHLLKNNTEWNDIIQGLNELRKTDPFIEDLFKPVDKAIDETNEMIPERTVLVGTGLGGKKLGIIRGSPEESPPRSATSYIMKNYPVIEGAKPPEETLNKAEDIQSKLKMELKQKKKKKVYEKNCVVCHEPFLTDRAHTKTCSDACRMKKSRMGK